MVSFLVHETVERKIQATPTDPLCWSSPSEGIIIGLLHFHTNTYTLYPTLYNLSYIYVTIYMLNNFYYSHALRFEYNVSYVLCTLYERHKRMLY